MPSRALRAAWRREYLVEMGHVPSAPRLRLVVALSVLLVPVTSMPAHGAGGTVALQAISTTVANPGDTKPVCIMIASNGNKVAGIQNNLSWDGTCATMTDPPNCYPIGSHGKQVKPDLAHQADFTVKVLVLALDNVDPIPDGPLYCCDFEGEADPGQCCPITVVGAAASDPSGGKLAAMGNAATICTANAADQPSGGVNMGSGQPLSGSNAPVGSETGAGSAPAPAPAAPAGAPVNQVLQGGGARVENPTIQALPPTPAPPAAAAPTAASSSSGAGAAPAAGSAPRPPLPPPTAALAATAPLPTAAVTEAPTQAPTAAPTAPPAPSSAPTGNAPPPTHAAPVVRQQAAEPVAKAEDNRGWFGCEIGSSSPKPMFGLGLIALFGAMLQRRRRARRPPETRTQR
jgi:hypothetical protein